MYFRSRAIWRRRVSRDLPAVYYGRNHIPRRDENAFGGIIKVQDLQFLYPNTIHDANILYLVSSSIPDFAPTMARYSKKCGVKLIINQNGTAYPAWHGDGWEKTNLPMRQLLEIADYVFYQSNFCKKAADLHLTVRNNHFEILHNPVDTETFVPVKKKPDGHRLISAGTHYQFYRVKCAVEAVAILKDKIPDIHLTFAGQYRWKKDDAKAKSELIALVVELGLKNHVSILGRYTQNEVIPLMQRHHIALHTKYNDPCPRSVSEALSCGLPVVHSNSGGVPELVGPDAGIGIPAPLDWQKLHAPPPVELAAATINVFDQYEKYSAAARQRSKDRLDVRPWIKRHQIIFQQILQ